MDITDEEFFLHVFVGGTVKAQGFVRWDRDTGDNAGQGAPRKTED